MYRCVNKKRREKVLFSSWAVRSAVIFEKCYFCSTNFTRGCQSKSKRVDLGVLIYFIGKGYFFNINVKMLNTLFRVSFDVFFKRISTQLTSHHSVPGSPDFCFVNMLQ